MFRKAKAAFDRGSTKTTLMQTVRSGIEVRNWWSFRGRPGARRVGMSFEWRPNPDLIIKMDRRFNRALFSGGRAGLRQLKKVLGRRKPKQYTKPTSRNPRGKLSSAYKRMKADRIAHNPYPYRGPSQLLRNKTNFRVNTEIGDCTVGVMKVPLDLVTVPSGGKTVPELLNSKTGGTAVRTTRWPNGGTKRKLLHYRSFRYTPPVMEKLLEIFKRELRKPL